MADILILGEHDKGYGEPFSPKTVSGRRLRRLIGELNLVVDLGNVFDYVEGRRLERDLTAVCASYPQIVALGQVAAAECRRQGIMHQALPHPAVRRETYLARLRDGLAAYRAA